MPVWLLFALGNLKHDCSVVLGLLSKFFGSLNAQGWLGVACTVAMAFLWLHTAGEARHWHKQSARFEKLYNRDEDNAAQLASHAVALKAKIDALSASISSTLKEQHDAQDRRIDADANAARMRGPGKAACSGNPGVPATPGGSQQPNRAANAAVDSVPPIQGLDLIGLPFADTIDFAQQHDGFRNEAMTWRQWYARLLSSWPK